MTIKNQIDVLKNNKLPYYSINIELKWNDVNQKYDKICENLPPTYADKKVKNMYDKSMNGTAIFLGKEYGYIIGVDVDDKNDTPEFFNDLCLDNNFDMNTFTMRTPNNGKHYYFVLNDEQKEGLKNFRASTGKCYTTKDQKRNIDIKYTNQYFYGPSIIEHDDKIFKYEIENEHEPLELPKFLYDEILRIHDGQRNIKKPIKSDKGIKEDIKKNDKKINKIDKIKSLVIRNYLDCLSVSRCENREDWLSISAIIFNECNDYDLFVEYSKKCPNKFNEANNKKIWDSFNADREKKVTIKKLREMAAEDIGDNKDKLVKAYVSDKEYILDELYYYGPSDLHMSYLFANLNGDDFIYDTVNKSWYYFNNYGIYITDREGLEIKKRIDISLIREIKIEYNRLILKLDDKDTKGLAELLNKYKGLVKYCTKAKNAEELISKLKTLYTVDKIYEKMDSVKPNLLGLKNGVLDIDTGEFRKGLKEDYISATTCYEYKKPDKKLREEAMNILRSIFPKEDELKYMLKKISLGLYGANPHEKFSVWIGSGGNGKGVLRDIISIVLGDYFDTMDISYLYKSNTIRPDSANPVMARKKNARYVISTEPEGDIVLKSSIIKSLTGNDLQQVRQLYKELFNYVPKFKLVIQTNTEPIFHGFDGGMKRRTELQTFLMRFVVDPKFENERKIDVTLKKKILIDKIYTNEFLDIFLEYYQLYKAEGLEMPKRFKDETETFIKNNLPVESWLEEKYDITGKILDKIRSSELYKDFEDYMDSDVCGVSTIIFKNQLSNKGINLKKCKDGNYYIGIKEKPREIITENKSDKYMF